MDCIAGGVEIKCEGLLQFETVSRAGNVEVVDSPAHCIPELSVTLLTPRSTMDCQWKKDTCVSKKFFQHEFGVDDSVLQLGENRHFNVQCDNQTFLPTVQMFAVAPAEPTLDTMAGTMIAETNQNISRLQKHVLKWHFKLGHVGFNHIERMGTGGFLDTLALGFGELVHDSGVIKCTACQFGTQCRRPTGAAHITRDPKNVDNIHSSAEGGGIMVHVDHVELHLVTCMGCEKERERDCGLAIFCDSFSGHLDTEHQVALSQTKTLQAKQTFERKPRDMGVTVRKCHTDNGMFTAQESMKELTDAGQGIRFSAPGAHHQNGCAEACVQSVTWKAQTVMMHALLHWPETHDKALWPLTVSHTAFLHNHTPDIKTGIAPVELLTSTVLDESRNICRISLQFADRIDHRTISRCV